ncbi:MAG: hypothetical protein KGI37_11025 [Alphaproteobacteria bacterium]|nr:hypothetical protein [Alphaproteobacteria bacterium]
MKIRLGTRNRKSGYIEIIIAILVLIVGLFIIYKLWRLTKQVLPPDSGTNKTATYYNTGGVITGPYVVTTTSFTQAISMPAITLTPSSSPLAPFTYQYRVSLLNSNFYIEEKFGFGNLMDGHATDIINTSNEYEIIFTLNSVLYCYDFNLTNGTETWFTNQYVGNPYTTIGQRSTDMVNWAPFYTNSQYMPGNVDTVTDQDPPPGQCFYRTEVITNN